VTEKAERPRDAAPAGGPAPVPVPGFGTDALDGDGRGPGTAAGAPSPVVRLAGVSCRRGRREAMHRVDLEVQPARVTGVLGPNGAGKSTLLGVVAGLYRPFEGTAWVLGEHLPARGAGLRRRIGVVLQETALYEELTVTENLRLTAALY